jgi:hypothetical protein
MLSQSKLRVLSVMLTALSCMFPNAPSSLKISWDNAISFEAAFLSQNYQGGVDEKGNRNQLNQVVGTQTLSLTIDSLFTYSEIDTFLTNNLGKPFYFNSTLYRCETFKWTPSSDKVFKLELSLIQVFRP